MPRYALTPTMMPRGSLCGEARSTSSWRRDLAGVLDQRHRFRRLLRLLGRAVRREPLFRRGHRHRRAQGQRSLTAGVELGVVSGLGKRPLHRSVVALFFGESVLALSYRGASEASEPGIHNHDWGLWIPGLRQVAHPGMTAILLQLEPAF